VNLYTTSLKLKELLKLKSNKNEKDNDDKPYNKGKAFILYKKSKEKLFKTI
jgi:hypothetical protein